MPTKKSSSKRTNSGNKSNRRDGASPRKGGPAARAAAGLPVSEFLRARLTAKDSHTAVLLINPSESTLETLRVAWPETCAACGQWFDFPAAAVASVIPLGVEKCCAKTVVKAGLKLKPGHDDLAQMLRSHLSGTLGTDAVGLASPLAAAAVRGRARSAARVNLDEELCGSDDEQPPRHRGARSATVAAAVMAAAAATTLELSGPQWVARFPTSRSIFDTKPPFLDRLSKFHQALVEAGATLKISATLRPPERAYLMHFSSKIARGKIDPRMVPPMAGVNIQWFHGSLAASKAAAQQMVSAYNIAFPPALNSRHTQGLAIDMTITWAGIMQIKDATGAVKGIGAPRSGQTNAALHAVGASYGVVKLVSDPPHWSSDGH